MRQVRPVVDFQERGVEAAFVGAGVALDDGPVGFFGAMGGEFGLGGEEGRFFQGDDEAAGCVGIEPVGEPGAGVAAAQGGEGALDAGAAGGAGMDLQAGRLVEHDEAGIAEQFRQFHPSA
jgi:hypothetical protein